MAKQKKDLKTLADFRSYYSAALELNPTPKQAREIEKRATALLDHAKTLYPKGDQSKAYQELKISINLLHKAINTHKKTTFNSAKKATSKILKKISSQQPKTLAEFRSHYSAAVKLNPTKVEAKEIEKRATALLDHVKTLYPEGAESEAYKELNVSINLLHKAITSKSPAAFESAKKSTTQSLQRVTHEKVGIFRWFRKSYTKTPAYKQRSKDIASLEAFFKDPALAPLGTTYAVSTLMVKGFGEKEPGDRKAEEFNIDHIDETLADYGTTDLIRVEKELAQAIKDNAPQDNPYLKAIQERVHEARAANLTKIEPEVYQMMIATFGKSVIPKRQIDAMPEGKEKKAFEKVLKDTHKAGQHGMVETMLKDQGAASRNLKRLDALEKLDNKFQKALDQNFIKSSPSSVKRITQARKAVSSKLKSERTVKARADKAYNNVMNKSSMVKDGTSITTLASYAKAAGKIRNHAYLVDTQKGNLGKQINDVYNAIIMTATGAKTDDLVKGILAKNGNMTEKQLHTLQKQLKSASSNKSFTQEQRAQLKQIAAAIPKAIEKRIESVASGDLAKQWTARKGGGFFKGFTIGRGLKDLDHEKLDALKTKSEELLGEDRFKGDGALKDINNEATQILATAMSGYNALMDGKEHGKLDPSKEGDKSTIKDRLALKSDEQLTDLKQKATELGKQLPPQERENLKILSEMIEQVKEQRNSAPSHSESSGSAATPSWASKPSNESSKQAATEGAQAWTEEPATKADPTVEREKTIADDSSAAAYGS